MSKKYLMTILLANLFTIMPLSVNARGGAGPGGGSAYSRGSGQHLANAINRVTDKIESISESTFIRVTRKYFSTAIKQKEFTGIIKMTVFDYSGRSSFVNPSGVLEPRDFTYGTDANGKPFIAALEPYFLSYNRAMLSMEDRFEIWRKLIHETAHVYGLTDDNLAYEFSLDVMEMLLIDSPYRAYSSCGALAVWPRFPRSSCP